MKDFKECTDSYLALLRLSDLESAADCLIYRVKEMDERMIEDVMYTLRGELKLRLIGEYI